MTTKAELRERIAWLQAENDALRERISEVSQAVQRPLLVGPYSSTSGLRTILPNPTPKTRYGGGDQ